MYLLSPNADKNLDLVPARKLARLMTRTYSKSFYLATKLLPQRLQGDVHAIYAFCRYTDNIVDAPRQRARDLLSRELGSWREELFTAYGTGESLHPVMGAFVDVALRNKIPVDLPAELIAGVQMDLEYDRYSTFAELKTFTYRVASVVGLMMTRVLGYKDSRAFDHAEQMGIAMQLANILRDVEEDWRLRRKIYLPKDELEQFGVTEGHIARSALTDNMRDLLAFNVERAHSYFEEASRGIPMLNRDGQFAIIAAARVYRGILYEIERNRYDVFSNRPVVSGYRKVSEILKSFVQHKVLSPANVGYTPET